MSRLLRVLKVRLENSTLDLPLVSIVCQQDFEEFPEHRTHFFYLLQAATSQCFPAFLSISPAQFKLILDSIIWAFKHTMRNVADTGLVWI